MLDVKLLMASAAKKKKVVPKVKHRKGIYLSFDKISEAVPKDTWVDYVKIARLLNVPEDSTWINRIRSILLNAADKGKIEHRPGIRGNVKALFLWRKE